MKHTTNRSPRTAWLLFAAPVLVATPAFAQETAAPPVVQTAPPPVVPTIRQGTPAQTPPPSQETGRPVAVDTTSSASKTTISPDAQAALDEPTPRAAAPRAAAPVRQTRTVERSVTRAAPAAAAATTAAPAATTPAPAPATPPAAAPAASTPAPAADTSASDTTAQETTTTNATTEQPSGSLWPLLAGLGIVVLATIAFMLFRRSRRNEYVEEYTPEETYVYREPVAEPVAQPVAVAQPAYADPVIATAAAVGAHEVATPAPSTPEEVSVTEAEAEEVAALTGDAPVSDRPWLEFAMRPVRAGTNVDEAMVEIELTVANAGNVAAEDVRVSTFMLTDAHADEMERYLVDPPADAAVNPVTIQPGEGAKIDATLAALKADLGVSDGFKPVVVADARYRLPDGSEGRTSASFVIGRADASGDLAPFDLADRAMHDDIEVRLHGTPEHA